MASSVGTSISKGDLIYFKLLNKAGDSSVFRLPRKDGRQNLGVKQEYDRASRSVWSWRHVQDHEEI